MASGKSTVAERLAASFDRAAHVRGDVFRRMIVSGRDPIASSLGDEALRQLQLRWRLAAHTADAYWRAGFTAVVQDVYAGEALTTVLALLEARPRYVVALVPRPDVVAARERARGKTGYKGGWDVTSHCERFAADTPHVGLWLDTSDQTPDETVAEVLARLAEAEVP
jgi:chloramphenicol 3-O-phosphotransferase